jgi:hypothetical protein
MTTSEKVAHLKGVMEGMEYDTTTKEGKLLSLIVDILDDLTIEVAEIEDDLDTLYDFADELDEDLGDVEADLYGDDDYDDEFDDEYDEDEDMPECCIGCSDDCSTCGEAE